MCLQLHYSHVTVTCLTFRAGSHIDTSISFFIEHCANRTPTPTATHCNAAYIGLLTGTSARNTRVDTIKVLLSLCWTLCRDGRERVSTKPLHFTTCSPTADLSTCHVTVMSYVSPLGHSVKRTHCPSCSTVPGRQAQPERHIRGQGTSGSSQVPVQGAHSSLATS